MGFNRLTAAADVAFPYICSQDTAILRDAFDAQAALAELDEDATDAEKTRLILDRFFADFPDCVVDRSRFEALPSVEALIETCEATARKLRHKQYRETGDESKLGFVAPDVIRWRLRMLQPRERAEAKGRLSEQPSNVSTFAHYYAVNRWIVSTVLAGADGWNVFAVDKKTGRATDATIDAIDEDWIIEIGDFVLEVPTLRRHEKKV